MLRNEIVQELNRLLRKGKLDLPDFRKEVNLAGKNVQWLLKNIYKRNNNVDSRVIDLLNELAAS